MGNRLKIKIEPDEYDHLCRELLDIAIEANSKDSFILLRLLQLLLYGEWEKETT